MKRGHIQSRNSNREGIYREKKYTQKKNMYGIGIYTRSGKTHNKQRNI